MKVSKTINIKENLHFYIFTQLNELLHWEATPSDIKILSELYNMDYDMLASGNVKIYEDRMAILFSGENKQKIMDKLQMSYNTFNNSLTKLRKRGLIKENTINEKRLFNLGRDSFTFTIEFTHEKGN